MFALQCALGLYFYLKDAENAVDTVAQISWLPVVALVIFIITYSVGLGPLPWAVMGEMFSSDVKAKASGITVSVCWFLAFLITKFSSNLDNALGNYATFWIFAGFCVLSIAFTVFILPETKGKSLQQIQAELNGQSSLTSDIENGTKKYWKRVFAIDPPPLTSGVCKTPDKLTSLKRVNISGHIYRKIFNL